MGIAYNKSTIQQFRKHLKMRQKALPVLTGKEAALRKAVKDHEIKLNVALNKRKELLDSLEKHDSLWMEMPGLLSIEKIEKKSLNVAGIHLEALSKVKYQVIDVSTIPLSIWLTSGIEKLKELVELTLNVEFLSIQVDTLRQARRKTTQKVNLYEKVQIPYYIEGIRKVKRFLEDKENIATAAKKIAKARRPEQA